MITVEHLSKRYGAKVAVDDLSFTVRPGVVTGFLGPNGAGKSTTMRMVMGLDHPSGGRASVNGRPYGQLTSPLREVGALLEARAIHPGRSAWAHAGREGIVLHELSPQAGSLEQAFTQLTGDELEYRASAETRGVPA